MAVIIFNCCLPGAFCTLPNLDKELFVIWYFCIFHHHWVPYSLLYTLKKWNIWMSPCHTSCLVLSSLLWFSSSSRFWPSFLRWEYEEQTKPVSLILYVDRKPASHTDCSLLIHPQITVSLSQLSSLTQSGHSDPSDVNVFLGNPFYVDRKCTLFFFFPAVKHYP